MHPMVYDCFLFFNELKVLKLRLEELNEVVDCFVLVESTRTFSDNPKPLYFRENKELFGRHAAKIRHVVVDEMPRNHESAWDIESFQRNAILRGLADANSDDLVIISDVDEVPRAQAIQSFAGELTGLELDHFYYKLNCKNLTMKWVGPALVRRDRLNTPQDARMRARRFWEFGTQVLPNSGWHFACMQDAAGIRLKLQSFSHQECNIPEFTDVERIAHKIKYGLDLVDRPDHFWCCVPLDRTFPIYVMEHREEFQDLIADFNEFHVGRQLLISNLSRELDKTTRDFACLQEELAETKEEAAKLRLEVSGLRTQMEKVLRSNSWRITEPLRRIARFARYLGSIRPRARRT